MRQNNGIKQTKSQRKFSGAKKKIIVRRAHSQLRETHSASRPAFLPFKYIMITEQLRKQVEMKQRAKNFILSISLLFVLPKSNKYKICTVLL